MGGSVVAAGCGSFGPEHHLESLEPKDGLCRASATWNKCTGFHFTGPYLPERRDLAVPTASFTAVALSRLCKVALTCVFAPLLPSTRGRRRACTRGLLPRDLEFSAVL